MVDKRHKYTMALNINNTEVECLAPEIARVTGEAKTEAIRQSPLERKAKLGMPSPQKRWEELREDLERNIWSKLPPKVRGKRIPKEEYDALFE